MKTRYRFIHFTQERNLWTCFTNRNKDILGICEYYEPWKKWQFLAAPHTGFTVDCLLDIADFLGQLKAP